MLESAQCGCQETSDSERGCGKMTLVQNSTKVILVPFYCPRTLGNAVFQDFRQFAKS